MAYGYKSKATKKQVSQDTINVVDDIVEIPISQVALSEKFDIRTDVVPQKPLVESIKERGQLTAVWVRATKNSKYELISGHRRLSALKSLKKKTVLARVFENLSYEDALNLAITENAQRQNLTPLDKAMLCLHLQEKGRKRKEIAALLFPHSKAKDKERLVQNYLMVSRTHDKVREALSRSHISFTHALLLAKCLHEEKGQELEFLVADHIEFVINSVKEKGLSVQECRELIQRSKAGESHRATSKRRRSKSKPVVFREGINGNWSLRVNFNTHKCDMDLDIVEAIEKSLVQALESVRTYKTCKTPLS